MPPRKPRNILDRYLLAEDYRARLPTMLSRFTGYIPPSTSLPHPSLPFPPFTYLSHLPLKVEVLIFAFIGSFIGIILIESIMSTYTVFHDVYHSPLIITSFGASAVLLFGVIESPLSQPRNFVGGHFTAAVVGVCLTRLFVLDKGYVTGVDVGGFHANSAVNGALTVAVSLVTMLVLGDVHPPAGATTLNAAVQSQVINLSWRYIPVILCSSLIMLAWACIINNLGRRRYPAYWWSKDRCFVRSDGVGVETDEEKAERSGMERPERVAEDGGRGREEFEEERAGVGE